MLKLLTHSRWPGDIVAPTSMKETSISTIVQELIRLRPRWEIVVIERIHLACREVKRSVRISIVRQVRTKYHMLRDIGEKVRNPEMR